MNKLNPSAEVEKYKFPITSTDVRIVIIDGNPWFVASDVCVVLEINNSRQAVSYLDDDEKGVTTNDTLGGAQKVTIVNESGLYSLVLRSRKPQAKAFKKWITSEVLPSIRKTGSYDVVGAVDITDPLSELERLNTSFAKAIEVAKAERARAEVTEKRVMELAPAAAQAELYAEADSLKELRSFARDIQQFGLSKGIVILQQEVYDYLGKIGIIIRVNTAEKNQATAKALKEDWAKNSTHIYTKSNMTLEKTSYAKLTAKGEKYAFERAVRSLDKYGTLNITQIKKILDAA